MANNEEIKRRAILAGGEDWGIISELVDDEIFKSLLTNQEKNLVDGLGNNPGSTATYRDHFANIIAKYIGWKTYKDSGLSNLEKTVSALASQIEVSKSELDDLSRNATLASGATALAAYSKTFFESANRHSSQANRIKKWYFISVLVLLVVIGLIFFFNLSDYTLLKEHIAEDMRYNLALAVFGLKAVIAFFFFQIVQFFRKNYNAEKHLEEIYRHRSDVLQSLHAVYTSIENKDEKDRLLSAAALFAYERGETGYISTKEGAGSGEYTESLIMRLLK